jgi:hypothetical protein
MGAIRPRERFALQQPALSAHTRISYDHCRVGAVQGRGSQHRTHRTDCMMLPCTPADAVQRRCFFHVDQQAMG